MQDYHLLSVEALAIRLKTNPRTGLSNVEALGKLEKDGPNRPSVQSPTIDFDE